MTVRIGAGPIGWYDQDFEAFRNDQAREARLEAIVRAGFDGLELGPTTQHDVVCVKASIARHGLAFLAHTHAIALTETSVETEFARLGAHIAGAKALGSDVLTVAETVGAIHADRSVPLSRRPRLSDDQWAEFASRLTMLADLAQSEGVHLVYRPHMGTIVASPEDIERLITMTTPSLGILLDLGHMVWAGGDPQAFARAHADRIALVHASDVDAAVVARAVADDMSYADAVAAGIFVTPGEGAADIDAVFAVLPHFAGWVVLDADRSGLPEQVDHVRRAAAMTVAA